MAIHEHIQEAYQHLPEGWTITIEIEQGSGTVRLTNPDGDNIQLAGDGYTMEEDFKEAYDKAINLDIIAKTLLTMKPTIGTPDLPTAAASDIPNIQSGPWTDLAQLEQIYDAYEDHVTIDNDGTTKVTYCNWCPDPTKPDPKYHPDGTACHRVLHQGSGSEYKFEQPIPMMPDPLPASEVLLPPDNYWESKEPFQEVPGHPKGIAISDIKPIGIAPPTYTTADAAVCEICGEPCLGDLEVCYDHAKRGPSGQPQNPISDPPLTLADCPNLCKLVGDQQAAKLIGITPPPEIIIGDFWTPPPEKTLQEVANDAVREILAETSQKSDPLDDRLRQEYGAHYGLADKPACPYDTDGDGNCQYHPKGCPK